MRSFPERWMPLVGMLLFASCGPICEEVSRAPSSVCRASGASIAADTPFALEALPEITIGSCAVTVSGSELELSITGRSCRGTGQVKPVPPSRVQCPVPALPAGSYTVKGTTVTLEVPGAASVPVCP